MNEIKLLDDVILNNYQVFLSKIIFKVHNIDDSQDILQDFYIKIRKEYLANNYSDEGKLLNWCHIVLNNYITDFLRSRSKEIVKTTSYISNYDYIEDEVYNSEDFYKRVEKLKESINILPHVYRGVMMMRFQGYSYQHISRAMDLSINVVSGRILYGKVLIRKLYN